jgi:hypothetical protein
MAESGLLTEVKCLWDGTETTADASAGATTLTVLDPTAVSVGDTVWNPMSVVGSPPVMESKVVTAVDETTSIVTLDSALTNAWLEASPVVPDQGGGPGQVWLADVVVPSQEEPIEVMLGWTDLLSLSEGIYEIPIPVDLEDDLSAISNTPGQFFPVGGSRLAADAIDGKTITGAVFQTIANLGDSGVQGMRLARDDAGGVIKFWTGNAAETGPGYINPYSSGSSLGVVISSPDRTGFSRGTINLNPGDVEVFTQLTAHDGLVVSTAGINVTGASDFQNGVTLHTADLTITGSNNTVNLSDPPTSTNATNARINTAGSGDIRVTSNTSLSRYKVKQEEITVEEARGILELTPITWYDIWEVEDNGGKTEGLQRIPGVTAEDVQQHVPAFATYGKTSAHQGVIYERLAVGLIPVVRELRDEVAALRDRVEMLENR